MKQLSYNHFVKVAALPTATASLAGTIVHLTTNNKAYWCSGTAWVDLLTTSSSLIIGTGLSGSSGTTFNGSAANTVSVVFGSSAGTVCQGNDSRLSNARTPTAHTHTTAQVTGLDTALAGKASASQATITGAINAINHADIQSSALKLQGEWGGGLVLQNTSAITSPRIAQYVTRIDDNGYRLHFNNWNPSTSTFENIMHADRNGITSANGIVWTQGNDGAGSGLDADTVDGIHASSFVQTTGNQIVYGTKTFAYAPIFQATEAFRHIFNITSQSANNKITHAGMLGDSYRIQFIDDTTAGGGDLFELTRSGNQLKEMRVGYTLNPWLTVSNTALITKGNKIWHEGNDGAGSGLDADTVDGLHAYSFHDAGYPVFTQGSIWHDDMSHRCHTGFFQNPSPSVAKGFPAGVGTSWAHLLSCTHNNTDNYFAMQFCSSFYNSNEIYYRNVAGNGNAPWHKMWHSGNDGANSGLDADLLDGLEPNTDAIANTIVQRNMYGYIYSTYFNTTSGATVAFDKIYVSNDNYIRYVTPASFISLMNLVTVNGVASSPGYNPVSLAGMKSAAIRPQGPYGGGITLGDNHADDNRLITFATWTNANTSCLDLSVRMFRIDTDVSHELLRATIDGLQVNGHHVWHTGNDGAGSGLDADTVDGSQPSMDAIANTIVQRNMFGYIYSTYLNTTSGTTTAFDKIYVSNDSFIRYVTPASFISLMNLVTVNGVAVSTAFNPNTSAGMKLAPIRTRGAYGGGITLNDNYDGNENRLVSLSTWANGNAVSLDFVVNAYRVDTNVSHEMLRATIDDLHVNGHRVWHTGNDGAGSGLDADTVDGFHASNFHGSGFPSFHLGSTPHDNATHRCNSGFFQTPVPTVAKGFPAGVGNQWVHLLSCTHDNTTNYYAMQFCSSFFNSNEIYYRNTNGNGATGWNKMWHSGNDGANSGLDADTVDGIQAAGFMQVGDVRRVVNTSASTSNSTTLTNVSGLNLGAIPVGTYIIDAAFTVISGVNAQSKTQLTATGVSENYLYVEVMELHTTNTWSGSHTVNAVRPSSYPSSRYKFNGVIRFTTTGTLQFQFAKSAPYSESTTIPAYSGFVILTRVS